MEVSASGSSTSMKSSLSQAISSQTLVAARTERSASNTNQSNPIQADTPIVPSDDMEPPREDLDNMFISQTEAADIDLELNELPCPDRQEWPLTDVLVKKLSDTLQNHTTVADNTDNE